MSNIFEYKPVLQYILQDINSIDNLPEGNLDVVEPYIRNNVTYIVESMADVKKTLDSAKASIQVRLEDVEIPFNRDLLDDLSMERLTGLSGSSKLINDGILSYKLLRQIKGDPLLRVIADEWEVYHAGMDGIIEAELEPLIDDITQTLNNMADVLIDTVLYDMGDISDPGKLKEKELLYIEEYLRVLDDVDRAVKDGDAGKASSAGKKRDQMEHKLSHRNNLSIALKNSLMDLLSMAHDIYDSVNPEFHSTYKSLILTDLNEFIRKTRLDGIKLKAILYSLFQVKYNSTIEARNNYKSILSAPLKKAVAADTIRSSRLYLDVAMPALIEMANMDNSDSSVVAINEIAEGIEALTNRYDKAMVDYRNILGSDGAMVKNHISRIYEKHRTRTMYKSIG